jgi:hypothetical protein
MALKVRKQIYIDPGQEVLFKRLSEDTGLAEAEIIRQAIDRQARAFWLPKRNLAAWERERVFILQLIGQGPVPGRRTWKREDLYGR